jgi:hypothetical protein
MQKRILLAAGHGGGDSGATGQGTTEAAEVIDIVNRVAQKLQADGQVEVVVVPHELNLEDEINWVNARFKGLEDGYALEIHKNSTVNAHGVEMWYFSGDNQSQAYAQAIEDKMKAVLPDRGVKGDATNRWGRLGWIRDTNPWAGLLECGFVSDGGDPVGPAANDKYAQAILEGVLNLWGLAPAVKPAPTQVPAQVDIAFRVYANDKQIGAYAKEENAWGKYANEGGTKIVDRNGVDVTAQFVTKFRPVVETPPVPTPPHPEETVVNTRLDALELAVKELSAKVELLWQYIYKYKSFQKFINNVVKKG